MSTANFAITTLIELAVSLLLIYGFMHEEKVIAFEQNIKRIVICNIRRCIRKIKIKRLNRAVLVKSRKCHFCGNKSSKGVKICKL